MLTLFVAFEPAPGTSPSTPDAATCSALIERLRPTPGLSHGLLGTPADVDTPFRADRPLPALSLQLYFASLPALEAALSAGGELHAIARDRGALPGLEQAAVTQQAMLARSFAVPQPRPWGTASPACGLLVHYPGPAQDLNAWLRHYIQHHTVLLAKFGGIRDVEVCTRVDWCDDVPAWRRADPMQRNRVVFDSAGALAAALASPVLDELRADSRTLPPFAGGSRHYPMWLQRFDGVAG